MDIFEYDQIKEKDSTFGSNAEHIKHLNAKEIDFSDSDGTL